MNSPSKKEFLKRAQQGNLVPVWRELIADMETPVSAYERLRTALRADDPDAHTFLLESVEGGEHIGRYSVLGGNPRAVFRAAGRHAELHCHGQPVQSFEDVEPLSVLKEHMAQYIPVPDPDLPRFFGGAVGYMGYDAVAEFERVPLAETQGVLDWPDMVFCITDTIILFDRVRHTMMVIANAHVEGNAEAAYEEAVAQIDGLCSMLQTPVYQKLVDAHDEGEPVEVASNVTPEAYRDAVERAKEYIRAGDIIQVVLSQQFATEYDGDPLNVYRALRSINPSPYMFCLEFGEQKVVGSSPEIHVRCEDRQVEVRPIAGTRPRSADPVKDRELEEELLADPKERAEHIMLVDLGRNDIGRVCDYKTVEVPELMIIERYSHVMHIVSDVVGRLSDEHDAYDLMRATFPAGTVSGAPKVRAMEIIAELEPCRRGAYAGAVGYFSFTGNLDSCITIRTVLLDDKKAYVQAGAGIVADSDPQTEYEETQNKARGMVRAIGLAKRIAKTNGRDEGGTP